MAVPTHVAAAARRWAPAKVRATTACSGGVAATAFPGNLAAQRVALTGRAPLQPRRLSAVSAECPWHKISSASGPSELLEAYREWAPCYDADSVGTWGYAAPAAVAKLLAQLEPDRSTAVLDAGAGTGQVGEWLASQGFHNLIAADFSADMLKVAEEKGCYSELHCVDLSNAAVFPEDSFDNIVSVGTITPNHVESGAVLQNWYRWLKPGGLMCLSIRSDFWVETTCSQDGIPQTCRQMQRRGLWELEQVTDDAQYTPALNSSILFHIRAYRKTAAV